MAGWDDVSSLAESPATNTGWDAVSTIANEPDIKLPDTSGIANIVKGNVAASNDNSLDAAVGMPVTAAIKSGKGEPLSPAMRGEYVKAIKNGSASDAGDFMQAALHAAVPIVNGLLHPIDRAERLATDFASSFAAMGKGGAGLIAYPFLSPENKMTLRDNGTFGAPLTPYKDESAPTAAEMANRALEVEHATVGSAMGALYAVPAAALSPVISPAIEDTPRIAKIAGVPDEYANMIPGVIGAGMDILGGAGLYHGAKEILRDKTQYRANEGPWANHPGAELLTTPIAEVNKKQPEAVTSSEVDTHIAAAYKDSAPPPQDFHDVAAATGIETSTLHVIYKETGVHPDQVAVDVQNNKQTAEDVSVGKVPESYAPLMAPKTEATPQQKAKLSVAVSDSKRAFNVIDENGDYVQGGFDSAEEATKYIRDKKVGPIPDQPPEWDNAPAVELPQITPEAAAKYPFVENKPAAPKPLEIKITPEKAPAKDVKFPVTNWIKKNGGVRVGSNLAGELAAIGVNPKSAPGLFKKNGGLGDIDNIPHSEWKLSAAPADETGSYVAKQYILDSLAAERAGKPITNQDHIPSQGVIEPGSHDDLVHYAESLGVDTHGLTHEQIKADVAEVEYNAERARDAEKLAAEEMAARKASPAVSEPSISVVKTDNPGGEWLANKQKWANEDYAKGRKVSGPVTGYTDIIDLPVSEAVKIKGANGENPVAGTQKFDDLMASAKKDGFNSDSPILVGVNHLGEPYILEGNNRAAVANALGEKTIRAEVKYYAGGEQVDGALSPHKLDSMLSDVAPTYERPAHLEKTSTAEQQVMAGAEQTKTTAAEAAQRGSDAPLKGGNAPMKDGLFDVAGRGQIDMLTSLLKDKGGAIAADAYRKAAGAVITAMEKVVGKLTGNVHEKIAKGYMETFQPELLGDKAKRADAFLAKYKTAKQEAENAFYRQSNDFIRSFDRLTDDQRMSWLYDHETGRWNEKENPDHARFQAMLDATYKQEKLHGASEAGYKDNYLPHVWEKPEAVAAYFKSDAYVKKYGRDGFTKRSTFQLVQDGMRAGFKLKTNNPERMMVSRLVAGHDMIATMDLLRDMEGSGIATPAKAFTIDKRIAKEQEVLSEAQKKYDEANAKINDPRQARWDFADPAVSKYMNGIKERIDKINYDIKTLEDEKASYKAVDPALKNSSFKVIGPDNKVWNIHNQVGPLWKNAMDGKGLWERQGLTGDAFRVYMQGKAIWVSNKLALSLFHPTHMVGIHLSSGGATAADHLIQGGKFSDLDFKNTSLRMGLGKEGANPFARNKDATLGFGRDHPAVVAWNTAHDARTPEQQHIVDRMVEGGFKPTMSAQDSVHFRENFDKAVNGVGLNNLRLIGSAFQITGMASAPLFQHWIPALKSDSYLYRTDLALKRDPSLATDAGRRGEVFRQIAKDTDRNYGEMNQDTLFWNKTVRDAFNASMLSGGWKLAMLQNFRGLAEPAKIAYNFAKTGEFSKEQITHQVLQSYIYTAVMLMQGAAITYALTGVVSGAIDWAFPNTGDKNEDGTAIRLNQPAFLKEGFMFNRDVNEEGLFSGTGKFLYHQTLIPGIAETLSNHDFIGRKLISDPTDLNQWAKQGWDTLSPITVSSYEKAEQKGSEVAKTANILGFPIAGAYINQTKFEQKILHAYSEQNPPKDDVYTAYLKQSLRTAIKKDDGKEIDSLQEKLRGQGMTDRQISYVGMAHDTPFVEVAWGKLSAKDQKRLIKSATEDEKNKFDLKSE